MQAGKPTCNSAAAAGVVAQACDDSTREDVKQRIDAKVAEMQQRGHHCLVTRRSMNKGFKAGNMINGMSFLDQVGATADISRWKWLRSSACMHAEPAGGHTTQLLNSLCSMWRLLHAVCCYAGALGVCGCV
jgi:hypothetical protein